MTNSRKDESGAGLADNYRAAYDELAFIHAELVAEAARLAEMIEARLTPLCPVAPGLAHRANPTAQ